MIGKYIYQYRYMNEKIQAINFFLPSKTLRFPFHLEEFNL